MIVYCYSDKSPTEYDLTNIDNYHRLLDNPLAWNLMFLSFHLDGDVGVPPSMRDTVVEWVLETVTIPWVKAALMLPPEEAVGILSSKRSRSTPMYRELQDMWHTMMAARLYWCQNHPLSENYDMDLDEATNVLDLIMNKSA